jgi:site-specific recombinase XerD
MLSAVKSTRDRAILLTLLDTGMRASELVNLTIDDWRESSLVVMGKGRKERTVPISKPTEKAIWRQLLAREILPCGVRGGNALFAALINGEELTYISLSSMLIRLRKYSGVKGIHAHRFRHTFAITFLRYGGDIYTLQRILGHSTLDMVKTYLDIVRSDIVRAHEKASPVLNWELE